MNTRTRTLGRLTSSSLLLVTVAGLATASSAWACQKTTIGFGGASCPPNPYGDPQPPYDCDLDGDGVNDSWCKPIIIPNPNGGPNLPATDSCGNTLSLPCVGDPTTPGGGGDHFRPTFKKMGETGKGTELGRCLYPCGRNTWMVWVCDSDGDGTPDKFTKSMWTTRDGGTHWPYSGKSKTFCEPLASSATTNEADPMVIVSTEFANGTDFSNGYAISDVVVLRSNPDDLGRVRVDGVRLDEYMISGDVAAEGMAQDFVVADSHVYTEFEAGHAQMLARTESGARVMMFENTLTNIDDEDHVYEVAIFGRNLSLTVEKISIAIPAGETRTFTVDAVETGPGVAAIGMHAYADVFHIDDPRTTVEIIPPATSWSDIDLSGSVGMSDLSILLNRWGVLEGQDPADLNDDGVVNSTDLSILLADWDDGE